MSDLVDKIIAAPNVRNRNKMAIRVHGVLETMVKVNNNTISQEDRKTLLDVTSRLLSEIFKLT